MSERELAFIVLKRPELDFVERAVAAFVKEEGESPAARAVIKILRAPLYEGTVGFPRIERD